MNIAQNMQIVAKGCFLAGTEIETPDGFAPIETLKAGDEVISYNEKTGVKEVSKIGDIDILQKEAYYNINNQVKVTGEHPFYTNKGITEVSSFDYTHKLIDTDNNEVLIGNFERIEESVTVYNLLDVVPNHNYYAGGFLVHNKGSIGGGRSSGGGFRSSSGSSKSSSSKSSSSKNSTSKSTGKSSSDKTNSSTGKSSTKAAEPSKPKTSTSAGTSKAKPGAKIKDTNTGKEVVSSTKKPTTTKKAVESKGVVGDNGYYPRFANGYQPPAGSVAYYPQHSFVDYLPWIYLFSLGGDSPQRDQVVMVEPSGKEVTAPPEPQGVDGLAVLNWILLIAIVLAAIGGIVWGVNKLTSKQ